MQVTFLGTGSAMPTADRVQTGLLIEEDNRVLLLDCGSGVLGRLAGTDVGYEGVDTVLLTHHHLDHVADVLPLLKARWLAEKPHLEIVGPEGTEALIEGLLEVHEYLQGRMELAIREVGAESFELAGFEIDAFETRHSVPCHAYRVAGAGGDFTYSGDSEAFDGLASFADGSAVLAHDCSFPDGIETTNHPTPSQLGETLAGHDIGRLYLTHLYPHTEGRHGEMIESVRRSIDADVRIATDQLRIEV